ncbi:hypothetical protein SAM23877_6472 [Streptomyces ambofaciens ATCC 23877]|uniref:Uncharacterized protein n=1 Tax=Streptomyces ambofaciens (strain ATCC 23877 / 3486 / DSM 40053 / JCM 4204 / NBRC 12836 / NRRL B-2516) TaxID=278992 RepID=A0A0K2B366_STRA7|nr:hypothetical protein SAM23877_6472 [Streptomyces ambofaciens ATCC 23877]
MMRDRLFPAKAIGLPGNSDSHLWQNNSKDRLQPGLGLLPPWLRFAVCSPRKNPIRGLAQRRISEEFEP